MVQAIIDYSQLKSLVSERYSCRNFTSQQVSAQQLEQIIELARLSPSACNFQPYHFYAVQGEAFAKIQDLRSWYGASTIILSCISNNLGWVRSQDKLCLNLCDLGLALHPMMLAAKTLGLDSCVIASFDPNLMSKTLGIDDDHIPIVALAVGYPSKESQVGMQHNVRKSLKEIYSVIE